MFELRIMVEDKNVPKVLWRLDGLVVGMPQIIPVRGAVVKAKKVVSTQPVPGGSLHAQVQFVLSDWPEPSINMKGLNEVMDKVGVGRNSRSYVLTNLRNNKVIKTLSGAGKSQVFKILKPNTEA